MMETSVYDKLKDILKSNPKKLLIPLCFIGVLLAVLPGLAGSGEGSSETSVSVTDSGECEEYVADIETRLKAIVARITGDQNAEIMVTLESGVEYIYASETKSDTDVSEDKSGDSSLKTQQSDKAEESYIIITNQDGEQEPLIVTKIMPDIKGVVIVCTGGNSTQTAEKIRDAAVTALGVSKNSVYITGRVAD